MRVDRKVGSSIMGLNFPRLRILVRSREIGDDRLSVKDRSRGKGV